ncbi:MAG: tRNA-dihydrouridine synthase, partial [Beijerinckiaceae bacterium]
PMAINGGIATLEEAQAQLAHMDGVMLGRAAYQNPELLLGVDPLIFGEPAPVADAFEALSVHRGYVAEQLAQGVRLHSMTKHLLGLFPGKPGARLYRRHLSTEALKPGAGIEVLDDAVAIVRDAMARREREEIAA